MNAYKLSGLAGCLLAGHVNPALGDSLRCGNDIVSAGATEQQVLESCGRPDSRQGDQWTYEFDGSFPRILTFGNGVLMFIDTGADPELADKPHPFGDRP